MGRYGPRKHAHPRALVPGVEVDMITFQYDSHRTPTRSVVLSCARGMRTLTHVQVTLRREDTRILDANLPQSVFQPGISEVSGNFHCTGVMLDVDVGHDISVFPEEDSGIPPFALIGCQLGAWKGEDKWGREYYFAADKVLFQSGHEVPGPEKFMVMAGKSGVVGQITGFEPTDKVVEPVYELKSDGGRNIPRLDEARECAVAALATALDRVFRRGAEDGEAEDGDALWAVTRVDLSSVYGDTDLKISVHGPYDSEPRALRAAARLRGHTFVHGPVSVAGYRRRT